MLEGGGEDGYGVCRPVATMCRNTFGLPNGTREMGISSQLGNISRTKRTKRTRDLGAAGGRSEAKEATGHQARGFGMTHGSEPGNQFHRRLGGLG